MKISIIVPVYNEKENLDIFLEELQFSFTKQEVEKEVIFIDDGSTDGSTKIIKKLTESDPSVKAIIFKINHGQTAAMSAGIKFATGDIIIPMDADLQNDPADIWPLVDKLNEGYDLVSGWRKNRKDKFISRRLPSILANKLISYVTDVNLHDYGCTIKAYKKNIIDDVNLYGEMHRFIPIYIKQLGGKITEIVVNHRERKYGKSKYGIGRVSRVMLDLLVVKFLNNYITKPIHFFGGAGVLSFLLGMASFTIALVLKFSGYASLNRTPLPLIGVFFSLIGFQLILMGLLAEIIMRNYFESNNKTTYLIKEKLNL
ncbi:MAG: glycosyl transferase [Candidatus Magasanikbacteria bacterium RIFCSPHIGHO2_01_FULL_33_34]|uniref:Glycosyl transferase n=1 Tax=Candidatus Magasanikbacteria bacterium RIFCSPHIGHO2_01_FULL_33_34 TaxID=1798671 RepID=A0A1F6LH97_9BACT|nr:MAG: glycosyl transferase [Candidatus Magasanikbacteria bacterium RIFCSPHIGHO2_01_FULL_33_34]OGH66123.1 MAG: glycosyl transferase [Candidatus Magasanikbacteria bacterium RIFCSPHIGHO2_02_FULL_33_17]OGH75969.1 MAG: glycosyl transferase [Candidatus Magasanikbacteria bacterium RIFCSPLOWO2_01_FULL_33_34]